MYERNALRNTKGFQNQYTTSMNPEMKTELAELIAQLSNLSVKVNSLKTQVDATHPDAQRVETATSQLQESIANLKEIRFGLESDFSYDD
ncbi:hypothetical protein IC229_31375 [Spirosoma sp. BT702]|uniref:Uncharacterized protein n=1 Tax=Spirosoma profusum TaxID=2771354 RepID=A0A927AVG6_9BACT|nr:hypothetical protein [Spirosoma profusum]MBD2705165.1 hypothetical protein [Spirosoma profusum]